MRCPYLAPIWNGSTSMMRAQMFPGSRLLPGRCWTVPGNKAVPVPPPATGQKPVLAAPAGCADAVVGRLCGRDHWRRPRLQVRINAFEHGAGHRQAIAGSGPERRHRLCAGIGVGRCETSSRRRLRRVEINSSRSSIQSKSGLARPPQPKQDRILMARMGMTTPEPAASIPAGCAGRSGETGGETNGDRNARR